MKKLKLIYPVLLLIFSVILFNTSCKDDYMTYADELKIERKLITDFVKRQGLIIVDEIPTEFPWEEKVYFKTKSGVYFRLTAQGDIASGDSAVLADDIIVRFDQYTLDVVADTLSSYSTINFPYPTQFNYLDYSQACAAWHEAVGYMKYNEAECQLIVPSKLGFPQFSRPATPVGYDMTIKVKKW